MENKNPLLTILKAIEEQGIKDQESPVDFFEVAKSLKRNNQTTKITKDTKTD